MEDFITPILQNHAMTTREPKVFAGRLAAPMSAGPVDDDEVTNLTTVQNAIRAYLKSAYSSSDVAIRRGRHLRRFIEHLPDGPQTDIARLTDSSLEAAMAGMRKAACGEKINPSLMVSRCLRSMVRRLSGPRPRSQ